MSDVRELLADAQAAEARGEKTEAIALLRRAAEIYRDSQNPTRAMKMLRHIRRLEGLEEDVTEPELPSRVLEERAPALAAPDLDAWCSFCCRPKREVGPLVAGPTGTFICKSCTGIAQALLGGAPAASEGPKLAALPHQQSAFARVSRSGSKVALLMGPAGSGRTTLLAALSGPSVALLDLDAPLQSLPSAARVVIAVRAEPPPAPLTVAGQPVYDTSTLMAACGSLVPEQVLAQVDAVGVLPAFDTAALVELARQLGVTDGADALVQLALKSTRPARELRALIARLSP
jgi:hypothetical protein